MAKMSIYDPALCCSTGVCGPGVDPELLRVATMIGQLQAQGVECERFNLAQQPQQFIANPVVSAALERDGVKILPLTLVDGKVVKSRAYPTNEEFISWTGARKVLMPL